MSVSNLAKQVEAGLHETQNQRDVRIEELWAKLDPSRTGELDLKGLQRGFKKIDHRKMTCNAAGSIGRMLMRGGQL